MLQNIMHIHMHAFKFQHIQIYAYIHVPMYIMQTQSHCSFAKFLSSSERKKILDFKLQILLSNVITAPILQVTLHMVVCIQGLVAWTIHSQVLPSVGSLLMRNQPSINSLIFTRGVSCIVSELYRTILIYPSVLTIQNCSFFIISFYPKLCKCYSFPILFSTTSA